MSSTTTPANAVEEQRAADLYNSDIYSWSAKQAAALRRRDFAAVDWDNVIEEIEDVGGRHRDAWTSLCSRTIEHLLAIEHHHKASKEELKGWAAEVRGFRRKMARLIINNNGLQGQYRSMFAEAWKDAREEACERLAGYDQEHNPLLDEGVALRRHDDSLPQDCPYRLEDVTAFDLKRDAGPRRANPTPRLDVWPLEVAQVLNQRLFTNYPTQEQGWSR